MLTDKYVYMDFRGIAFLALMADKFKSGSPPRWFGTLAYITHQVSVLCYTFITYFASYLALRYVISNYLQNEYMDSEFS